MENCDFCGQNKNSISVSWGGSEPKVVKYICDNPNCATNKNADIKCPFCETIKHKLSDKEFQEEKFKCKCGHVCEIKKSK